MPIARLWFERIELLVRSVWVTRAAMIWCIAFAVLHLYWALGGSAGLASSAGRDLAEDRPVAFVIFGLYGAAAALLAGSLLLHVAASSKPSKWRSASIVLRPRSPPRQPA